jgi:putative ABC transport system ATP-binding protein
MPGRLVLVSTHDDRITNLADRVIELVPRFAASDTHREPETVTLEAGQVLFRQGDRSDLVYTIAEGRIQIYQEYEDGSEEVLAVVESGDYFGELGPMLNLPRSASARALTDARLVAAPVATFRKLTPKEWATHVI